MAFKKSMKKTLGQTLVDAMREAGGLEVHEVPFAHLTEGAAKLARKITKKRPLFSTKEEHEELAELYRNNSLIHADSKHYHAGDLLALEPTHFTASKDRLVFIRETKDNALAKFLSAQPLKTMRQPTRAKQEWRTV